MFFFYKYRMIYHLHSMCIQYISNIPSFPLIIPHSSHCNHPFLPHNMLHCHNRNRFLVMAMLRVHHPQSLPWASAWDSYIYIYIQLNDLNGWPFSFFWGKELFTRNQSRNEWSNLGDRAGSNTAKIGHCPESSSPIQENPIELRYRRDVLRHQYLWQSRFWFTIWVFNIAMENGPFIDDVPIKTSIYKGFSMAMLNNHMVNVKSAVCSDTTCHCLRWNIVELLFWFPSLMSKIKSTKWTNHMPNAKATKICDSLNWCKRTSTTNHGSQASF